MGGEGNDTLEGNGGADDIDGQSGDDIIDGGKGDDFIQGGTGDDKLFGSDDSDTFFAADPDGSDEIQGGQGEDFLVTDFSDRNDVIEVLPTSTRVLVQRTSQTPFRFDVSSIENLTLNAGSGEDSVTIGDLSESNVGSVLVSLGPDDDSPDSVEVRGTEKDDGIAIGTRNVGEDKRVVVEGLSALIRIDRAVATQDSLLLKSGAGDDKVVAQDAVSDIVQITLNGGTW